MGGGNGSEFLTVELDRIFRVDTGEAAGEKVTLVSLGFS